MGIFSNLTERKLQVEDAEEGIGKQKKEDEFNRVKLALDVVSSNVMLADANNTIVYANDSVLEMLKIAESDIRKKLTGFSVGSIVGSNVDVFHKNPAHQIRMLSSLKNTYKTEISVGVRTFELIASPIIGEKDKRLGTVVEWRDRTNELAFENLVDGAISSAVAGDLSNRIDTKGSEGFFKNIGQGINSLLEIFEDIMSETGMSMSALADGKLDRKIEKQYAGSFAELKENVNATVDKLVEVVSEIRGSADQVSEGSSEISMGISSLSKRTEEQAASLEETSAAMEEVTTTVHHNASNAKQANTLASEARESAMNGGGVVSDAVAAMEAISDSSEQIADIINVIDEIAFQTNLLALNAAVEAARAGDQGKGFAVVAEEVRSLAGRSAVAAKEIKGLIKDSGQKVKEGSDLVNRSGSTLNQIIASVQKVNDIIAEISTASEEQAMGLDEINKAVGQMDEMTQQNATMVEQAAAASKSLEDEAGALDQLLSFFKTDGKAAKKQKQASQKNHQETVVELKPRKVSGSASDDSNWSRF